LAVGTKLGTVDEFARPLDRSFTFAVQFQELPVLASPERVHTVIL
jgi:hypothetical protein